MCGISVVINGSRFEAKTMSEAIKRRGSSPPQLHELPDGTIVGFNHLPIVGMVNQPFMNTWLNGFISNYKELALLHNIKLSNDSDTEFLARFLARFGLTRLHELNGFFAVVWYDYDKQELHTFTDRYGIKQLYKYKDGSTYYICSEVKGILALFPEIEIDRRAKKDWQYSLGVLTPDTVYKGIRRVPCLDVEPVQEREISYEHAKIIVADLLEKSFKRNDTKLRKGVFLSGGVDSGILAKNMNPEYCFSMDYTDPEFSEIETIKTNSTAKHLTIIHNDSTFDKYAPLTLEALDDYKVGACYTNFALTELAAKMGVQVLYSGAGADEIFDGYTHRYNRSIIQIVKRGKGDGEHSHGLTHKEYDWLYLRGILVVEDRMAGWHTIETRYPFLDNDLVNFVMSLPKEYKENKRILRDVCGLHPNNAHGKKRGFSNPGGNQKWIDYVLEKMM